MMAFFETTVITLGLIIVVCGLMKLTFVPLSLFFELRAAYRRGRDRWSLADANPLVSVIVPGYNEENVLENCVHSIMDSDYPNLEVILVDDGSTDSTPVIMRRLSSQYNAIRFIHQQNQGKGAALNTGIARSLCSWIRTACFPAAPSATCSLGLIPAASARCAGMIAPSTLIACKPAYWL